MARSTIYIRLFVQTVYRTGRDRGPILIRFSSTYHKSLIFRNVGKVRELGLAVSNDYTFEERQTRKSLYELIPTLRNLKFIPKIRDTKILVDGKLLSEEQVVRLIRNSPALQSADLRPTKSPSSEQLNTNNGIPAHPSAPLSTTLGSSVLRVANDDAQSPLTQRSFRNSPFPPSNFARKSEQKSDQRTKRMKIDMSGQTRMSNFLSQSASITPGIGLPPAAPMLLAQAPDDYVMTECHSPGSDLSSSQTPPHTSTQLTLVSHTSHMD